jgi:hypothetical protein
MAIGRDLQLLTAVVVAILGVGGALAIRGPLRLVILLAGLLVAAYLLGLLPHVDFLPDVEPAL